MSRPPQKPAVSDPVEDGVTAITRGAASTTTGVVLISVHDVLLPTTMALQQARDVAEGELTLACPETPRETLHAWVSAHLARTERPASEAWAPTALLDRLTAAVIAAYGRGSERAKTPMTGHVTAQLRDAASARWDQLWIPIPGVREALRHLKTAGWSLVCWGLGPVEAQRTALRTSGLEDLFDVVHYSAVTHPLIWTKAVRTLSEWGRAESPAVTAVVFAGSDALTDAILASGALPIRVVPSVVARGGAPGFAGCGRGSAAQRAQVQAAGGCLVATLEDAVRALPPLPPLPPLAPPAVADR